MEVPITQFRRKLFDIVNRAFEGDEVWVAHKGRRFRIVPEHQSGNRLSRITPLDVINPKASGVDDDSLQQEMVRAWERDWSTL